MTNRKSHTRFRLVPKSTTLDKLEEPLHTLFQNTRMSEPTTKIWMKIDPYYQRRRYSPMTLVSGKGLCGYSRGFPGEGASNDSGVIENVDFQGFRTLRLRHLTKWSQHYYIVLAVITRPPDGVLLAPLALAARRLRCLASLREQLPVVRTEFSNRSAGVASAVLRT